MNKLIKTLAFLGLSLSLVSCAPKGHIHNYGEWIAEVPSTCISHGTMGHYHCDGCGKDFDNEHEELSSLELPYGDHQYGEWIIENPSTCSTHGTAGHYTCSVCHNDFDAEHHILNDLSLPYANHRLSKTNRVEPSCTEEGMEEYYTCSDCNKHFSDENGEHEIADLNSLKIPALNHSLEFVVTTNPSTTQEGLGHYACSREGCNYHEEDLIILKTPSYSVSGNIITVNEVAHASKYYFSLNNNENELPESRELSFNTGMIGKDLFFYVTTQEEGYYEKSFNSQKVGVTDGTVDLRSAFNPDFEKSEYRVTSNSQWEAWPYANFGSVDWYITTEADGNACGKMTATGLDKFDNGIHKDLTGVNGAGNYVLSFDVKLSPAAEQYKSVASIYANINYDGGYAACNLAYGNLNIANSTSWTKMAATFTKSATPWSQLLFFYNFNGSDASQLTDNFILVDNIEIAVQGSTPMTNVDTLGDEGGCKAGRFDKWSLAKCTTTGNYTYMDTVYMEASSVGVEIVEVENNNHALKVYNQLECCEFNLHAGTALNTKGMYKIEMDIYLSPESGLINFGMRAWSGATKAVNDTQIGIANLAKGEWVTISYYVDSVGHYSGNNPTTDNVNLFFWSFANNNNLQSEDNYFLIDNVHLYSVSL